MKIIIKINLFENCKHYKKNGNKQRKYSKKSYLIHKKERLIIVKKYADKNKIWTQERKSQWRIKKLLKL